MYMDAELIFSYWGFSWNKLFHLNPRSNIFQILGLLDYLTEFFATRNSFDSQDMDCHPRTLQECFSIIMTTFTMSN